MGIVNVTPDSFSDGGRFLDPERAIAHGRELAAAGCRHPRRRRRVDPARAPRRSTPRPSSSGSARWSRRSPPTGAGPRFRSTPRRPRSPRRRSTPAPRSSTTSPPCAPTPSSPRSAPSAAARSCSCTCWATPRTMQDDPRYDDVVDDVRAFLAERIETAVAAGVDEERIWVDPGIGFGKTVEHNLELLRRLGELASSAARSSSAPRASASSARSPAARSTSGSAARSRRTCSRSPPGPRSSGSTTSPRSRQALDAWRRPIARPSAPRVSVDAAMEAHRRTGASRRSRSSCAGSRSTPTTGSPTPSRRSASGSMIDVSFDVPDCDAVLTDRLEDTIDYAEVADIVALAATERSYRTLERLAQRDRRAADGALRLRDASGCAPRSPSRRCRWRSRRSRSRSSASGRSERRRADEERSPRTSRVEAAGRLPRASAPTSAIAAATCAPRSALLGDRGVAVEAVSSAYETEPVGEILDQPDFLNAAVRVETGSSPRRCSTSARRSRPSGAAISPARATGRARSTSTCCCSATSSSRPSG